LDCRVRSVGGFDLEPLYMESFFKLKTTAEVVTLINAFDPLDEESLPVDKAFGRVLGRDFLAPEDLPAFFKSAMDGFAVRARDTFGASEGLPALLNLAGEVRMGAAPKVKVGEQEAVRIATGGMLPDGADGVVMVEYAELLDETTLEVSRPIAPLENVIQPGDDFRKGAAVIPKGVRLRMQEIGALAGFGCAEVSVHRRPVVGIISTGDEIVPCDALPAPGQVRDINRYTLEAFCLRHGAEPQHFGICPDRFEALEAKMTDALGLCDTVWVSGGSSVGMRDLTLSVLEALPGFELLVHGVSISPGKPTILGRCGGKPFVGLPGHVASALVVAEVFLRPLLGRLSGVAAEAEEGPKEVSARLARNIESVTGREDYVRVRLFDDAGTLAAEPVFGKSGLISTLIRADGLVKIGLHTEGLYQGETVRVMLLE